MRSGRAKVLHRVGGLPLATWSIRAVRPVVDRVVLVVGHERASVQEALAGEGVAFAVQDPQHGTGHAMACAREAVGDASTVVVLAGDVPRLTSASLGRLVEAQSASGAAATLLTFRPEDPSGYGRILRDGDDVVGIVEHRDASEEQLRLRECNSGLYAFDADELVPLLDTLPRHGSEIYLTDAVGRLVAAGRKVAGLEVPEDEVAGINTQAQLAQAEARYRRERAAELMESGVTLVQPESVVVDADASAAPGSVLGPFVALEGGTRVGSRCEIGPFVRLRDCTVGDGAVVRGPLALASTNVPAGAIVQA